MSPIITLLTSSPNIPEEELASLVNDAKEYHERLAQDTLFQEVENQEEFAVIQETETPEVTEPQA